MRAAAAPAPPRLTTTRLRTFAVLTAAATDASHVVPLISHIDLTLSWRLVDKITARTTRPRKEVQGRTTIEGSRHQGTQKVRGGLQPNSGKQLRSEIGRSGEEPNQAAQAGSVGQFRHERRQVDGAVGLHPAPSSARWSDDSVTLVSSRTHARIYSFVMFCLFHRQSFHFDTREHTTPKPSSTPPARAHAPGLVWCHVRCVYSERAVTVPSHRLSRLSC